MNAMKKHFTAGTKVRVLSPTNSVPHWSTWDDDRQRTSTPVKRKLQSMFFAGDKRVHAAIVYISSESEREALKRKNMVKVELKDPAGSRIVITADMGNLEQH